jgi:hypothetical protein
MEIDASAAVSARRTTATGSATPPSTRGAILPSPDMTWTDHAFQSRYGYYSTPLGQQLVERYRQRKIAAAEAEQATELFPGGLWRHQISYAFDLPAPGSCAQLLAPLPAASREIIDHYIAHTRELAANAVLRTTHRITIDHGADDFLADHNLPSVDVFRGLAVAFRQLYARTSARASTRRCACCSSRCATRLASRLLSRPRC